VHPAVYSSIINFYSAHNIPFIVKYCTLRWMLVLAAVIGEKHFLTGMLCQKVVHQ